MTIDKDGLIGIGNTAPANLFTVGSATSTFEVNRTGNLIKINNVPYSWPASQGGASTVLTNDGSGVLTWEAAGGSGGTLQTAYDSSTGTTEIFLGSARGALTIADSFSSFGGNLFEIQDRTNAAGDYGRRYLTVSSTSTLINPSALVGYEIGVGTSAPDAFLHIEGALSTSNNLFQMTDSTASGGFFKITDGTSIGGHFAPMLRAKGIGTGFADRSGLIILAEPGEDGADDPAVVLDGRLGASPLSSSPLIRIQNNGTVVANFQANGDFDVDTNTLFVDASANSVGIGDTTPDALLDVESTSATLFALNRTATSIGEWRFLVTSDPVGGATFSNGTLSLVSQTASTDFTIRAGSTGNPQFVLLDNGNAGFGNTAPANRLTVGSATSTFEVNSAGNLIKVNNVVYSWPASQGGASTVLTNNGSGALSWSAAGGLTNLNQAYLNSTSTAEISLSPSIGALTVADTFSGIGNIFEIQDRTNPAGDYSQRYFTVSSTGTQVTNSYSGANNSFALQVINLATATNADGLLVETGATTDTSNPLLVRRSDGTKYFAIQSNGHINIGNLNQNTNIAQLAIINGTSRQALVVTDRTTAANTIFEVRDLTNEETGDYSRRYFTVSSTSTIAANPVEVTRTSTSGFASYTLNTGTTNQWSLQLRSDGTNDLHIRDNVNGRTAIFASQSTGFIGIGNLAPASRLTVGSATSTFEVDNSGNLIKINNVPYSWPASQGSASTVLQNNGSGTLTWTAVSGLTNLNQAYLASTSTAEISLSPSVGSLTVADTFSGTGNIFEIQNRTNASGDYSQRYLTVSSTSTNVTVRLGVGGVSAADLTEQLVVAGNIKLMSNGNAIRDFNGNSILNNTSNVISIGGANTMKYVLGTAFNVTGNVFEINKHTSGGSLTGSYFTVSSTSTLIGDFTTAGVSAAGYKVGIGTGSPNAALTVVGGGASFENLSLSNSAAGILSANVGFAGYVNVSGGIGTGGSDSVFSAVRLTNAGNLVNIGSIQAGETRLTSAGTLAAKVDYTLGVDPIGVAIGDLNGDGKADVAVANEGDDDVSIFINAGNGTFAAKVDYPAGNQPNGVAIGDLNGDGKADVATVNEADDDISVLINDGDGTFATKVDYGSGDAPFGIAMGDVNGDGKIDLMSANRGTDNVSVLINKGDGTFATKVDYAAGDAPFGIAMGDMNGDGFADISTANSNSDNVSVLINDGDGTFAAPVNYAAVDGTLDVVIGDLNNDSFADIAATNLAGDAVSVFINDGDGTFAAKVDYAIGDGGGLDLGDLNGDGFADIAAASLAGNDVVVFINDGDGTFATGVTYDSGVQPQLVAIGDLNGDGKADVAMANSFSETLSIYLNTPSTMFYAQASTGLVGVGTAAPTSKLHIVPDANTTGLAVSGYSLTGAAQNALLSMSGTWNTSGAPAAISLNITDTASTANAALMGLAVNGTTRFGFRKDGKQTNVGSYNTSSIASGYVGLAIQNDDPSTNNNAQIALGSSAIANRYLNRTTNTGELVFATFDNAGLFATRMTIGATGTSIVGDLSFTGTCTSCGGSVNLNQAYLNSTSTAEISLSPSIGALTVANAIGGNENIFEIQDRINAAGDYSARYLTVSSTSTNLIGSNTGTGDVLDSLTITRLSNGTAATGLGAGLVFRLENGSGGNAYASRINTVWTDSATGTEDSRMDFSISEAGVTRKLLSLTENYAYLGSGTANRTLQGGASLNSTLGHALLSIEGNGARDATLSLESNAVAGGPNIFMETNQGTASSKAWLLQMNTTNQLSLSNISEINGTKNVEAMTFDRTGNAVFQTSTSGLATNLFEIRDRNAAGAYSTKYFTVSSTTTTVNGNLHIGDVAGSQDIRLYDVSNNNYLRIRPTTGSNFEFDLEGTSSDTDLLINQFKVSIGTNTAPAQRLTVGSATSTFEVDISGNLVKVNNIPYSWPSTQGGASTVLTNNGSGALTWGAAPGSTNLNQAYLASTSTAEISLSPSIGAVTIADTFSGTGNIFEIQNRTDSPQDYSQRYFTVSSTSTRVYAQALSNAATILAENSGTAFVEVKSNGSNPSALYLTRGQSGNTWKMFHDTVDSEALRYNFNNTERLRYTTTGLMLQTVGTTGAIQDMVLDTSWTSGTVFNADFGAATTQTGAMTGAAVNFSTNLTSAPGNAITGYRVDLPALTATANTSTTYTGFSVGSAGTLTNAQVTSVVRWVGASIAMPVSTHSNGILSATGVQIVAAGGSNSGSKTGLSIDLGQSTGGTETGIWLFNPTSGGGSETGLRFGTLWDAELKFDDASPLLQFADGSTTTFGDNTGNTLMTLTDIGSTGDLSVTGTVTGLVGFNTNTNGAYRIGGAQIVDAIGTGTIARFAPHAGYVQTHITAAGIPRIIVSATSTLFMPYVSEPSYTFAFGSASNTNTVDLSNARIIGNLTPETDNLYDLGDYNRRWRDLWLSGGTANIALDQSGTSIMSLGFESTEGLRGVIKTPAEIPLQLRSGNASGNNGVYITSSGTTIAGDVTITGTCTGCGGGSTSFNQAYLNSTSTAEISLSPSVGALTVADAIGGTGNIFEIQDRTNPAGDYGLRYLTVSSTGTTATTRLGTEIFQIFTGNLKVGNGAPSVALNGEDAYIEGTFEVDGTSNLAGALTLGGATTFATASNVSKASGAGTFAFTSTAVTNGFVVNNTGATLTPNAGINFGSSASTGTGFLMGSNSLTTGTGANFSSSSNLVTSATGVAVSMVGTMTATALSADLINGVFSPVYSGSVTTPAITGNLLDLTRNILTTTSFASTMTVSGALASFTDNSFQNTGTITHTANVLALTQNYAASSGSLLKFTNAGTGKDIEGTGDTWSVDKAGNAIFTSCTGCGGSETLNQAYLNSTSTAEISLSPSIGALTVADAIGGTGNIFEVQNRTTPAGDFSQRYFTVSSTTTRILGSSNIISTGTVGLTVTGGQALAAVANTTTAGALIFTAHSNVGTSNAQKFSIDANGDVAIGGSIFAADAKLAVRDSLAEPVTNIFEISNSLDTSSYLTVSSTNTTLTYGHAIASGNSALQLTTNGITSGQALQIQSNATSFSGNLAYIALTGNNANNTGSLLHLNSSGALSRAKILEMNSASAGSFGGTGAVRLNLTGNHSFTGLQIDDVTTNGTAMLLNAPNIQTGVGLLIDSTTATSLGAGSALRVIGPSTCCTGANSNGVVADFRMSGNPSGNNSAAMVWMAANGLTSGRVLHVGGSDVMTSGEIVNISTRAHTLTTGSLLTVNKSSSVHGAMTYTGDLAAVTMNQLFDGGGDNSGSLLGVRRSMDVNGAAANPLITGAVAAFTDDATLTLGSLRHGAPVVLVSENYLSATGTALTVVSSATGGGAGIFSGSFEPLIVAGFSPSPTYDLFRIQNTSGAGGLNNATHRYLTVSSTSTNISTGTDTYALNLGTGLGAKTVTIGSQTGASALVLNSGTGGTVYTTTENTGNAFGITANSLSTGNGLSIASTGTSFSSGRMLSISKTAATGATAFTGDIANITYSQTFNTGVTLNSTGNVLDISRAITTSHASQNHTVSGALMTLSDSGTVTLGTLTHTANVLAVTQNYAAASGPVINITNAGTGKDIEGTSNTWSVDKAGNAIFTSCTGCGGGSTNLQQAYNNATSTTQLSISGGNAFTIADTLSGVGNIFEVQDLTSPATGDYSRKYFTISSTSTNISYPALTASPAVGVNASFAGITSGVGVQVTGGGTTGCALGCSLLKVVGPTGAASIRDNGIVDISMTGAYTTGNNNPALLKLTGGTASSRIQLISATALTSGNAFAILSTGNAMTTGSDLLISHTGTVTTGAFSGSIANISYAPTYTTTSTMNSGNVLNVSRSITENGASVQTITGAVANFTDSLTLTTGFVRHGGNVVQITQNFMGATNTALNVTSSATGGGAAYINGMFEPLTVAGNSPSPTHTLFQVQNTSAAGNGTAYTDRYLTVSSTGTIALNRAAGPVLSGSRIYDYDVNGDLYGVPVTSAVLDLKTLVDNGMAIGNHGDLIRGSYATTGGYTQTFSVGVDGKITTAGNIESTGTLNISGSTGTNYFGTDISTDGDLSALGNVYVGSASNTNVLDVSNARITGNLTPDTDNTYSLGDYDRRWKDLWLSGGSAHIAYDQSGTTSLDLGWIDAGGRRARMFSSGQAIQISPSTGSTSGFHIGATGNVGIATSAPGGEMEIASPNDTDTSLYLTNSTTGLGGGNGLLIQESGVDGYFWNYEAGRIYMGTSGSTRLNIAADGLTHIGSGTADGTIATALGDLYVDSSLEVASTSLLLGFTEVCSGACTGNSAATAAGDLFVEDTIEAGSARFDVGTTLIYTATASTNGVCSDFGGLVVKTLYDCSGTPSDIAEWYPATASATTADILVATDVTLEYDEKIFSIWNGQETGATNTYEVTVLDRTSTPYDNRILGIVSTSPYKLFGDAVRYAAEHPVPMALTGRVPTRVTLENGSIKAGDPITTSSTAGAGMKSTRPGAIVGFALEGWSGPGEGVINVLVQPGFHSGLAITTDGARSLFNDDFSFLPPAYASASQTAIASRELSFIGSAWDSGSSTSVTREISTKLEIEAPGQYQFAFRNDDGNLLAALNQDGDLSIAGALTVDGGFDYAESFPAAPDLDAGDIVMVDPANETGYGVKKSDKAYENSLIGVISTKPGFLTGKKEEDTQPVALAGRVPVKVNTEGGAINPGDPITSSSERGVGMKAVEAGRVIGIALEGWNGAGEGLITLFVNPSWWNGPAPAAGAMAEGALSIQQDSLLDFKNSVLSNVAAIISTSGSWSITSDGQLAALKVEAKDVVAETFTVKAAAETPERTVGVGRIQAGYDAVLVANAKVKPDSLIVVTFEGNPGANWWIDEKVDGHFVLKLAQGAHMDLKFTYWIVPIDGMLDPAAAETGSASDTPETPPDEPEPEDPGPTEPDDGGGETDSSSGTEETP